jgi:hypothetical protein
MKASACSAGGLDRGRRKGWHAVWPVGLFAFCAAMAGCQSAPPHAGWLQRSYRPDNTFAYPPKLPLNLQRVAVLPVAAENANGELPEGCAALAPVLWEQLVKTKKFEVVAVDAAALRRRTGQAGWTGGENLPPEFLAFLRREYGCDGVLFAELTAYRGYAPLAVGWRLKLVDARSGQIVWAADEVFDAAHSKVAKGLQKFDEPPVIWPFLHEDNWVALNSPRQLGRYAAAALLETMPDR